MEKLGKIILTGVILLVIAAPLGFIVGRNAKGRIAKFAEQGINVGLGLNTLPAIDKAKDVVVLSDQKTKEINQMIEGLIGTTSTSTVTTTN